MVRARPPAAPRALVLLSAACVALFAGALWAENAQEIVPVSSDLYDCLDAICLESGMNVPSTARPYSVDEFWTVLERIDPWTLSEAGKASYRYLRRELEHHSLYRERGGMELGAELRASVEGYLHTAEDFLEWEQGYGERRPLVDLPLEAWAGSGLYALLEPVLTKDPYTVTNDPDNVTNVITDFSDMDPQFPHRAFLAVGGRHWSLELGRDMLSWGAGQSGNLMLSDNLDWYDALRFTTYWKAFKLTAAYVSLENWDSASAASSNVKAFLGHRLEFRFLDRITIAVLEGMMLETPSLELRYLNPLMVFHGYMENDRRTNINLGLEIEANPWRWVTLYGQLCGDQIQSAYEEYRYPGADASPSAWGFLAGAKARVPIGPGYLRAGIEWARADPWLYLISGQPDYLVERRVFSNFLRAKVIDTKPLGYWTGPDAVVLSGGLGYTIFGTMDIGVEALYLQKGENGLDALWHTGPEAVALTAPSGATPERRLVLSLSGSWSPWPFLTVASDLSWVHVLDYQHVAGARIDDVQWVPSVSLRLRK
jgi:hypothetical protein